MNTKQYLIILFLFVSALSCGASPTAEQLQDLDPEARRWVLEQQQKVEDSREERIRLEKEFLELQKEVFNWPLDRKIETLRANGPYPVGVDEPLVRKMLSAQLTREYSVKWQGNKNGLTSLRSKMEYLRPYVIGLSNSDSSLENYYAVELGKYLKIDGEVGDMFYDVLDRQLSNDRSNIASTLDAIFGYNLDSPELRQEIIMGLSTDNSQSRFGKLGELWAGKWGLADAAGELMTLVEDQFAESSTVNRTALKSIKELGESASSVHDRLKQLYDKVKEDGSASFREIEALEHALSTTSPRAESSKAPPFSFEPSKDDLEIATFSSSGSPGEDLDSHSAEEATSNKTNNQKPLLWLLITVTAAIMFVAVWLTKRSK